jgi:hypothetical protein
MGRFAVHPVAQRAIRSPVDVDIQERKVAVSLRLHGELNVLVDTVQVVEEVLKPVRTVGPDVQLYGLHGFISQKMILFKTTAVKTSNPTDEFGPQIQTIFLKLHLNILPPSTSKPSSSKKESELFLNRSTLV